MHECVHIRTHSACVCAVHSYAYLHMHTNEFKNHGVRQDILQDWYIQ